MPIRESASGVKLSETWYDVIPIVYVPLLMITHFAALYLLVRPQSDAARAHASDAAVVDGISGR
jgi:hypothetical protein